MKRSVNDPESLDKCKSILNDWSSSRPYSPTKRLGDDAELVSAVSHTIERFTLTTAFRVRYSGWRQMPKGTDYHEHPHSANEYDIWKDVLPGIKDQDFDHGIEETSKREECPNPECRDGQVTCKSCDGKGEGRCSKCSNSRGYSSNRNLADLKNGGYIACSRCHRTGWMSDEHGGYKPCPDCNPHGYGSHGTGEFVDRAHGKHPGWIECPVCHGTGIATCSTCKGSGHVDCPVCEGQGYIVRQYFVIQKCATNAQRRVWRPKDGLTEKFYSLDGLPWDRLFSRQAQGGKLDVGACGNVSDAVRDVVREDGLEVVWGDFDDALESAIAKFRSDNNNARHVVNSQCAEFEQYDGVIEYDYRYEGKPYTVWINLATGAVEECENGLFASIAEETVKLAQESEAKNMPQEAIYYYCKADAISLKWGKENETQKRRVRQYRILGLWFGGSMCAVAAACWLPALLASGMSFLGVLVSLLGLAAITACMISLNEAVQVGGLFLVFALSYVAKGNFGGDFGADFVAREGYLLSMLFYAWSVVTFATDHAQRLPGGTRALVIGGAVAGVAALPLAFYAAIFSQSFVVIGGMIVPLFALIVYSLVRLPVRLKAGKMQRFVEMNEDKGELVRQVVESRKPCAEGVKIGLASVSVALVATLFGLLIGGVFDWCAGGLHFQLIKLMQTCGVL